MSDKSMPKGSASGSAIASLWFRLIALGIVALVFAEALHLAPGKAQGWSFYLTSLELIFEVLVRLIVAALAGIALGTICTVVIAPLLWYLDSSRDRVVEWSTKIAVVVAVFFGSRFAVTTLIAWAKVPAKYQAPLLIAHFALFALAMFIPRGRKEIVTSLDGVLDKKTSRRIAIVTAVGTVALVVTEFVFAMAVPAKSALAAERPKSNFILITFDALDAEDMSLYGRKLPTTPNIDAFASKATVFTNFYSASTFTTPSVATILTGLYPSESHVYQLQGRVSSERAQQSLPHAMRAGGYATGAFLSNPFAYYLARSLNNDYDFLPQPAFERGGSERLWNSTRLLHQDTRIGSRLDEYFDLEAVWNTLRRIPRNTPMRFRPAATFEQAQQVLAKLPNGYFLWIHVLSPHNPYIPDAADHGRFLPPEKVTTFEDEYGGRWKPHFAPDQQSLVDERRLRYDEFIATTDRAFGAFISQLENSGKLHNTTVIVSADHGEGFEGGVYQHSSPDLTRPVIHVPLIIRTPGQQDGRRVAVTADQTSLGPTILELAGLTKPDSMRGPSLVEWLNRDGQGEGKGLAFSQYFEKNSAFRPLHHGTVGVLDGQYEYVLDLDTQKGTLRPLSEAQIWNVDRTAENPERAAALRATIAARFPFLVRAER